jgi:hypothetical protein
MLSAWSRWVSDVSRVAEMGGPDAMHGRGGGLAIQFHKFNYRHPYLNHNNNLNMEERVMSWMA